MIATVHHHGIGHLFREDRLLLVLEEATDLVHEVRIAETTDLMAPVLRIGDDEVHRQHLANRNGLPAEPQPAPLVAPLPIFIPREYHLPN